MSSIKKLRKVDLQELAEELGLSNQFLETDLKQVYIEKLGNFIVQNPDVSPIVSKYVSSHKNRSPSKSSPLKQLASSLKFPSTPSKNLDVSENSIGSGASTDDEVEEEVTQAESSEDETANGFEAVSEESHLGPFSKFTKFSFFEKISSKPLEIYGSIYDSIVDKYYDLEEFFEDQNESVRDLVSSPVSIVGAEIFTEFFYILYYHFEWTTISRSYYVPQLVKENLPYNTLSWPIWNFETFFNDSFLTVIFLWSLISIFFPLLISFYVNFTAVKKQGNRKLKNYKYSFDPLIFSLVKLILTLIILQGDISFDDVKDELVYRFTGEGIFYAIKSYIFHGALDLRLIFGNAPILGSAASTFIALYALTSSF
ncbi:hypothetical protein PACTADRAFT_5001 [Pachysolen tannophilus NRRL Y-2460]|uniref:Uncharacterized protein n=1 Tax=Pachysolen tannophilus NRRL Y-2460 TaxID=669874 RepID=A0A1E4TNB4_PACTA|nr:hypothetical protein PACTADRAFT_5001 [Pachysolen tannophilus NRRL Y-2460]